MSSPPNIAERGMAVGLRALNRVASSGTIDRLGLRDPVISLIHGAVEDGSTDRRHRRAHVRRRAAALAARPPAPGTHR